MSQFWYSPSYTVKLLLFSRGNGKGEAMEKELGRRDFLMAGAVFGGVVVVGGTAVGVAANNAEESDSTVALPAFKSAAVLAYQVPGDLRYTTQHVWVRVLASGNVQIGITDFAQSILGDIVYVSLPATGANVSAGSTFGQVESTKSITDLYAPISGAVVATNSKAIENPALLNSDPYGDGWLIEMRPSDRAQLERLLDSSAYRTMDII
jgi:glycine cleavage system H protein